MNAFYERILRTALSHVVDVEVNPADVAGVRIPYGFGTAEFSSIALSALYQLLLLNPQRGCAILSGLREWERSHRLTDTWAANTPCWASLGELGWEGCADEEIVLSSCGLNPPTPASPRSPSPAKPAPAEKPKPPAVSPPKPTQPKKLPASEAQVLRIEQQLIVVPGTPSWTWEWGEGEAAPTAKAARGTPLVGGGWAT